MEYNTQDALAVAYAAYKKNNGYVKDTRRFSEDNPTIFANKELVKFQFRQEFRPPDFKELPVDDSDYASVDEAMKHFRRYTIGMLGEQLSDFQKDIIQQVWQEKVDFNKLGLIAYVPELVKRDKKESGLTKLIRTEYRNSQHISTVGEPIEGVCLILDNYYSNHYERFKYTADYMGNLISFWNKFEIAVGERKRIKAKVKEHIQNKNFSVSETALNYVRLYKV